MPLSDWASSKSDGTLPLQSPASQVQYRRLVRWEVDLFSFGIGGKTGRGRWSIELKLGDATPLAQIVQNNVQIISLGVPGLQLFTWQLVREKISTTFLENTQANIPPLDDVFVAPIGVINTSGSSGLVEDVDNRRLFPEDIERVSFPSWLRTLGGSAPTSEFGTAIPGGGSDYSNQTAIVEFWWNSPVYEIEVLPGAKLHVIQDTWGLGVSTRPEWQWRFKSASGFAALPDAQSGLFYGQGETSGAQLSVGYFPEIRMARDSVKDTIGQILWKDQSNRLFLCGKDTKEKTWKVWYSDIEGLEMLPLLQSFENTTGEQEEGGQVAYWEDGFEMDDVKPYLSGNASIARYDGNIYLRISPENITVGPMREVAAHDGKKCWLVIGHTADGRERILVTDGGNVSQQSTDGGFEWDDLEKIYAVA